MLLGFKNTLLIFVVSMVGKLTLASMFAYAVSRFDFKLKKLILTLFMLAMLIPSITSQVATFQIINSLGLFNKIWSVILLNLGTDVISVYVFYNIWMKFQFLLMNQLILTVLVILVFSGALFSQI